LLVGNSRWHWAEATVGGLRIRHRLAAEACLEAAAVSPTAWAAVGRLPAHWTTEPAGRVVTADVPLHGMPDWLGVDRALAGWLAWRQRGGAVLVADAGTVLSLTRVDADGRFAGGRLMAGLALQWRAMAEGTAALPAGPLPGELTGLLAQGDWPAGTGAAMAVGVAHGLAAALAVALRQARAELPGCRLVLTGGDASALLPLVRDLLVGESDAAEPEPDLALRGLVALRPPLPGNQARPRSLST
jgi:type III pantothenate kinase